MPSPAVVSNPLYPVLTQEGPAFAIDWHDVCHLAQPPTPMTLFLATFSKEDFSPLRASLGLGKIR